MIKKNSNLTLTCLVLLTTFTNAQTQEKKENVISVKRSSNGYSLSIDANNLPLENLLEKLTNQFPLRVITYGVDISQPMTICFKEVPLERGIKRLLKESGINNHFIQYKNDEKRAAPITVLTLLANGTKTGGKTIEKSKEREGIPFSTKESDAPEDTFAEKIIALKKRYEWADEEIEELAGYLLELMPEPVRDQGMEVLKNELDWRIAAEGNDAVDEEIFFQALENTVPSHLAPVMMNLIKQHSQGYKTGTLDETDEWSPNQLYQEVMSTRFSKRNNNLKGGCSNDKENH
jgi:hypothetical protein